MPYSIKKTKEGAVLVKKATGKVVSHHASVEKAKAAMRAIYANTGEGGGARMSDLFSK